MSRFCEIRTEALGTDYAVAKDRCDRLLNPQFHAWRTGTPTVEAKPTVGTFDWVVYVYKASPRYSELPQKTRASYDAALALVSKFPLINGKTFGELRLNSITGGAADKLYAKLKVRASGGERSRTAQLCVRIARLAWSTAARFHPKQVPNFNPFADMRVSYKAARTRAVTLIELRLFVEAADKLGYSSLGTAALIAFFWLQRQVDIRERFSWTQYRPADNPNVVRIFHRKTGELVDLPLFDDDGTLLWPELTNRLDATEKTGTLIVTRERLDRCRKMHLPWEEDHFRHCVAKVRAAAGIDRAVKFMGLRHGGLTTAADAGLTDAQLRALSTHKTPEMITIYAQETSKQRLVAARKYLAARTERGNLSE